ncbi:hypothetical protein GHK86_14230 [Acidimicrobiaceae bacterium USS-CC1]|uniref:Uncharacterized protein n=1 Tax=Acidiferrimicrobium australe TaxID=2664430 RepID=A0ABW9QW48_9ACTN|nr:hypothetical protein [Acidiferrimicrobium australe]
MLDLAAAGTALVLLVLAPLFPPSSLWATPAVLLVVAGQLLTVRERRYVSFRHLPLLARREQLIARVAFTFFAGLGLLLLAAAGVLTVHTDNGPACTAGATVCHVFNHAFHDMVVAWFGCIFTGHAAVLVNRYRRLGSSPLALL